MERTDEFRERDIVLVAANKDGGAHVDTELTPQYESLKQRGGTLSSVVLEHRR